LSGECCGLSVVLGHSGIGPARAARLAEDLTERFPIGAVLAFGFAGALRGDIEIGRIILADRVFYRKPFPSDDGLFRLAEGILKKARLPYAVGSLITVERIAPSAKEKGDLAEEKGGIALDMESGAVAEIASRKGIPFLSVRAVSDSSEDPLDPWLAEVVTPEGGIRYCGVLYRVFSRPARILSVNRLRRRTRLASRNLNRFLIDFLAGLSGS
jgi:nucleoside phosphorylase